ncbi:MAG: DUF3194 domain-containing protein [Candidatus Bathyarchaeota archaeon]|nr:DUF3194 domain-containing protein [Candidatus Bathyarchaeota archaeon]
MVELGIPELTTEQFEEACTAAEKAARKLVLCRVAQKFVEKLDISVEAEGIKPVNFTVEVDLKLSKEVKDVDHQELTDEAVKKAFEAIENYLRKLKT